MPSKLVRWCAAISAAIAVVAPAASRADDLRLTLEDARQRALSDSPSLRTAEAALAAARGRSTQSSLGPNPELRVDLESFDGSGPYRGLNSSETTVGVSQTLELGGKRRTRMAAAKAEALAVEIKLAIAKADLLQEVSNRYIDAWGAQEKARLAREAVARAEDLSQAAQLLVDTGREPPLRALRARNAAAAAQAELQAALADDVTARSALGALWSAPSATFSFDLPPPTVSPSASLPKGDALDVRLAEAELTNATAILEREKALATPNVTIEGGVRRFEETDDHALVASVVMPIPIRDRNQGAIAAARADVTAAEVRRNQALADAIRAERDARGRLAAAELQVATMTGGALPEAEQALRLARLGYAAGKFSLLEVLDAESALHDIRISHIQAEQARAKSQAALARALAR